MASLEDSEKEDRQDARLIYDEACRNLDAIKNRQLANAFYGVTLFAAVIAINDSKLTGKEGALDGEELIVLRAFFAVISVVACLFGSWAIWRLQKSAYKFRSRMQELIKRYFNDFLNSKLAKPPKQDIEFPAFYSLSLLAGAVLSLFLLFPKQLCVPSLFLVAGLAWILHLWRDVQRDSYDGTTASGKF